ncbi:TPA: hypothetical protein LA460_000115 [Clostridium botulinum]|nr:hypothetical protein [Clostridium botulinum]HBJ1652720.1 hypothetical protein [Clostridium botulinum]
MILCEMCGKEIDYEPLEICLDGTNDFYRLEVCKECEEKYEQDYFEPKEVDIMMGV